MCPRDHRASTGPHTEGRTIRWARLYDLGTTILSFGRMSALRRKIVELAAIAPGERTRPVEVPLGSGIVENAWYRLELGLLARESGDLLRVIGSVWSHTDPSDPDSDVAGLIGSFLQFEGSLDAVGLEQEGFVGMAAWADLARVNTSITNFLARNSCN